ncbi:MAG: hypothetical protein D6729_16105 [Deltaproteobacteria bacterium]|nr:MAG: hypothetical protein D6729_16105 [Deltaproteobacteria bacterium]
MDGRHLCFPLAALLPLAGLGLSAGCAGPAPEVTCGPGTVKDGNRCVLGDSVCEAGTTREGERCVPDLAAICGEGTVALDGVCYSLPEALARQSPVEASEEDDPSFGGHPTAISLPPEGDSLILHGIIEAVDHDGDQSPDQDLDLFQFSAQAGEILAVSAVSDGLPMPLVFVLPVDENSRWSGRALPLGRAGMQSREILFPEDGEYLLLVTDQGVLTNLFGPPIGGADFGYFVTVERRRSLDPSALSPRPLPLTQTGRYGTVSDAAVRIPASDARFIGVRATESDPAFEGAEILVFDAQMRWLTSVPLGEGMDFPVAGGSGDLILVPDYTQVQGAADPSYEIRIDPDLIQGVALPETLEMQEGASGGLRFYYVDVPAGTLLEATAEPTGMPSALQPLLFITDVDTQILARGSGTARAYFEQAQTAFIVVADEAPEETGGGDYGFRLRTNGHDVVPMSALAPAQGEISTAGSAGLLDAMGSDVAYLAFPVTLGDAFGRVNITATASDASLRLSMDLFFQSEGAFEQVATAPAGAPGAAASAGWIPQADGFAVVRVRAEEGSGEVTVNADWEALPVYAGEADLCENALSISGSATFALDLTAYGNEVSSTLGNSCIDYNDGADAFFFVTVPDGASLTVEVSGVAAEGTPDVGGADPAAEIVRLAMNDCAYLDGAPPEKECLDGSSDAGPVSVNWINDTGLEETVLLIVDNYAFSSASYVPGDRNYVTVTVR